MITPRVKRNSGSTNPGLKKLIDERREKLGLKPKFKHKQLSKSATQPSMTGRHTFRPSMRRSYDNNWVGDLLKEFESVRKDLWNGNEMDEENDGGPITRVDLKAMSILKHMKEEKVVGTIPGIGVNSWFEWRAELYVVGLHRYHINGIDYMYSSTYGCTIATSVVMSGNYTNNYPSGDLETIHYTGEGGQDSRGLQVKDQTKTKGNLAMLNSARLGTPVRFILTREVGPYASASGRLFHYCGLYRVHHEPSDRRPIVFTFVLNREPSQERVKFD